MARVNITRQIKTPTGWKNVSLNRDGRGWIKWGSAPGRYILEWYEGAQRRRRAAGTTPAQALEAQRRKRLELDALEANVELPVLNEEEDAFPLKTLLANFLMDIRAFRKPLTCQNTSTFWSCSANSGAQGGRAPDLDRRRQEIPRLEKIKRL